MNIFFTFTVRETLLIRRAGASRPPVLARARPTVNGYSPARRSMGQNRNRDRVVQGRARASIFGDRVRRLTDGPPRRAAP